MLGLRARCIALGAFLLAGLAYGNQLQTRQSSVTTSSSNYTALTPQFFTDKGSKRTKITYGPFVVPSMDINNGMIDYHLEDVDVSCTDCTITYMEAGLEYPNGSYANANTSLWLHHTVLFDANSNDTVCSTWPQRFFASGNERTKVSLCIDGTDQTGYYLGTNHTVALIVELMNQAMENQTAVLTMTYETIPGLPSGFRKSTPIWLDVTGCGDADIPAQNISIFNYTSPIWQSTVSGRLAAAAGHLHDGGTHITVIQNEKPLCDNVAAYGQTPGYIDAPGTDMMMNMSLVPDMNMDMMGKHISSMTVCDTGSVKVGDTLGVQAFYNMTEYVPMVNNDGTLTDLMGIALLYLSNNETGNGTSATSTSSAAPTSTSSAASSKMTAGFAGSPGILSGVAAIAGAVVMVV